MNKLTLYEFILAYISKDIMALGHQCTEVRDEEKIANSPRNLKEEVSENDVEISFYEKERLRQLLLIRLEESGWRRRLRDRVQNMVYNMPFKKLTIEDIVQELAPKASSTISDDIKDELITQMKRSKKKIVM